MNMKQSCKALICAIEGELDGRHCTEEQAAAILDHALPSLTEALARVEAERDELREQVVKSDAVAMANHFACDTAQAQLAEAVGLMQETERVLRVGDGYGWEDRLANNLTTFLARHAQAEQQEAQDAQLDKDARIALLERELDRERDRADMAEVELQHARAALATQPAV